MKLYIEIPLIQPTLFRIVVFLVDGLVLILQDRVEQLISPTQFNQLV